MYSKCVYIASERALFYVRTLSWNSSFIRHSFSHSLSLRREEKGPAKLKLDWFKKTVCLCDVIIISSVMWYVNKPFRTDRGHCEEEPVNGSVSSLSLTDFYRGIHFSFRSFSCPHLHSHIYIDVYGLLCCIMPLLETKFMVASRCAWNIKFKGLGPVWFQHLNCLNVFFFSSPIYSAMDSE